MRTKSSFLTKMMYTTHLPTHFLLSDAAVLGRPLITALLTTFVCFGRLVGEGGGMIPRNVLTLYETHPLCHNLTVEMDFVSAELSSLSHKKNSKGVGPRLMQPPSLERFLLHFCVLLS